MNKLTPLRNLNIRFYAAITYRCRTEAIDTIFNLVKGTINLRETAWDKYSYYFDSLHPDLRIWFKENEIALRHNKYFIKLLRDVSVSHLCCMPTTIVVPYMTKNLIRMFRYKH